MTTRTLLTGATVLSSLLLLNAPLFAAVESDVVGYTTITMEAGKWYQVGTPFVTLEEGEQFDVNMAFSSGFSDGDQLYIYNHNPQGGGYFGPYEWMTLGGQTGWFDLGTEELCTSTLEPGQAVFIHKKSAGSVMLPGRVSTTTAAIFGSEAGNTWAQITCVYPVTHAVNDLKWQNIADGDQLYIYNNNPQGGGYFGPYEWMTLGGQTGWFDLGTEELCTSTLEPGQAVFIYKKSKGIASLLPNQVDSKE